MEKTLPEVDSQQAKCFISNRNLVDGRKVGYMERKEPNEENAAIGDTGWAFYSGDEDEAFWKDSKNYGIYSLNTIAVFAPEMIPYLPSPFGSAFYRGKDGKYYAADDE